MKKTILYLFFCTLMYSCSSGPPEPEPERIVRYQSFSSRFVQPRNVDIWLPPGYYADSTTTYPVLYMHDGQNLFFPELSYGGEAWEVDSVMEKLIAEQTVRPCIVVGIWNTDKRFFEYLPEEPVRDFPDSLKQRSRQGMEEDLLANEYLRFLTEELIPFVEENFRAEPAQGSRFISGSSMGGLISLYAICRYPELLGGAACISTHWPVGYDHSTPEYPNALIDYFGQNLPDPATHRIYFDFGTATLDSLYEPYQQLMDLKMEARGYQQEINWKTLKFEGAEHNEKFWRERLHLPLAFLLGKQH